MYPLEYKIILCVEAYLAHNLWKYQYVLCEVILPLPFKEYFLLSKYKYELQSFETMIVFVLTVA